MTASRLSMLAVCALMGLSFVSSARAEEFDWKPVVSEAGRFSVLMTGTPKYTESDVPTPVGPVRENLYSYEHGPLMLDAEYSNLPFLAALFGGRGHIYRDVIDEFLNRAHATEIRVDPFTFDAYHGRILTYETPTRYGKLWMLLISRRVHVLHASVPRDYPDRSVIDYYFTTFKPLYKTVREMH